MMNYFFYDRKQVKKIVRELYPLIYFLGVATLWAFTQINYEQNNDILEEHFSTLTWENPLNKKGGTYEKSHFNTIR